jgi:protein-S-isoprenylcysteine O-methyltransferase Ste14
VVAACAAQQILLRERWTAGIAIKVRMALHTGESELRDHDYYGATVKHRVWPIVFLPVGIALLYYGVIAGEESYLERVFGDGDRQYRARVRRWV